MDQLFAAGRTATDEQKRKYAEGKAIFTAPFKGAEAEADDRFVKSAVDDDDKRNRVELLDWVRAMNGSALSIVPGSAHSFLPKKNFYQRVEVKGGMESIGQAVEMALNWNALGKGKGGLYGAAIRWGARNLFSISRETTVTVLETATLNEETKRIVDDYKDASRGKHEICAFWAANAPNVVALAGSLQMSIGHHFDSKNVKPQKAVIGALGQAEDVDEDNIRALFYLSVHPIPMRTIEQFRLLAADGVTPGFTEAVRVRALGVPAGYAVLNIAVVALKSMEAEPYWDKVARRFANSIGFARDAMTAIRANPTAYHVNATSYGVEKKVIELDRCHIAQVVGIAYARAVIGGTLANAASLKKFVAANSKAVGVWQTAFADDAERRKETLEGLLSDTKIVDEL